LFAIAHGRFRDHCIAAHISRGVACQGREFVIDPPAAPGDEQNLRENLYVGRANSGAFGQFLSAETMDGLSLALKVDMSAGD